MTNFSWIDGSIVGLYIVATMIAGIAVRKYVSKSSISSLPAAR